MACNTEIPVYVCMRMYEYMHTRARIVFYRKTEQQNTNQSDGFAFGTAPRKRQAYFVSVLKGFDDVIL
jgi:hypothetical protein